MNDNINKHRDIKNIWSIVAYLLVVKSSLKKHGKEKKSKGQEIKEGLQEKEDFKEGQEVSPPLVGRGNFIPQARVRTSVRIFALWILMNFMLKLP